MSRRRPPFDSHSFLTVLLALGVALLPRLVCPCQMPAYAGLLGSQGLAFLTKTVYLFPLTAMCLTFAVGGLVIGAERRQGCAPFIAGAIGAIVLLCGKFVVIWIPAVYCGINMLLAASLWDSWPSMRNPKLKLLPDGTVETAERQRR